MIDYTLPLDQLPNPLPIEPLRKPFDVTITPPGSKSITCRAYVLAALAKGESKIIRPLRADDTDKLLDALCTLGAVARWAPGGEDVFITGVNGRFPRGGSVNLGDGGAPTRFMIACACLAAEPVIVDGSKRMRQRPIAEGVNMLRQLGAKIDYVEEEGRLPVRVVPSEVFEGGELRVGRTSSSQFISALLLIAGNLPRGVALTFAEKLTTKSYVHLTVDLLHELEFELECEEATLVPKFHALTARHLAFERNRLQRQDFDYKRIVIPSQRTELTEIHVQPDASSCVYWWAASAIRPRSAVWIPDIGLGYAEPDYQFFTLLYSLGCEPACNSIHVGEHEVAVSSIRARAALCPTANVYDFSNMPDASLAFGTMVASMDVETHITGLHTLRHKETDRIAALATELRKVGCEVQTTDDSITITPSLASSLARAARAAQDETHGRGARATAASTTAPVIIETYNDHRMAMAFAVLGLARPGISIKDPHVVSKSYPTFWKDFAKLYQ